MRSVATTLQQRPQASMSLQEGNLNVANTNRSMQVWSAA